MPTMFQSTCFVCHHEIGSLLATAAESPWHQVRQAIPVPGELHRGQTNLQHSSADPESVRA